MVLAGGLEVAFDDRVIEEYREVLLRPRFGSDPAVVEKVVQAIEAGERVEAPLLGRDLPDADDAPFVETAIAARADALVTGNRRHFPPACGVTVMSPTELLGRLGVIEEPP